MKPQSKDVIAPTMNATVVQKVPSSSSTTKMMIIDKITMKIATILYSANKNALAPRSIYEAIS